MSLVVVAAERSAELSCAEPSELGRSVRRSAMTTLMNFFCMIVFETHGIISDYSEADGYSYESVAI